jgi:hypothetical protein
MNFYFLLLQRNIIYYFFIVAFTFCSLRSGAQEELGYVSSNYAGVNSLFINPSGNVDSKIFIDVHLIGLEAFVHNNVGYYPKPDYSPLTGNIPTMLVNESERNKRGFAKLDIIGPSVAVSWDQHSFGLFTRFRTFLDAKMDKELFVLALKNFDYSSYYGKSLNAQAYANTISWFETGLSYGYMYKYSSYETIDFGINVKQLIGYNSSSVTLSKFDFIFNKKRDISINEAIGGYRITQPAWGVGRGWGVDLGVNYQKKLEGVEGYRPNTIAGGCKHIDYKYKVGLSVLDLGAFNVNKNAVLQEFDYKSQPFKFDSSKTKSFKDVDNLINTTLTNNGVQQTRGASYYAWLPFGISGQFDYNFENNFYVNVTTISSFKIQYQTKRIDVISVTPRYERKYFEIAMPVSLIDYRYANIGLAFRFGNNLIIGTNRLDTFFGKIRDVYGGDIYINLKFAFYRHCGGGSGGGGNTKRYKKPNTKNCPAYQ